jgi:hypothetical protein
MRGPDPLRIVFISAITVAICVKSLYWIKGEELRNPPPVSGASELVGLVVDSSNEPVANASVRARAHGIDHVWSGRTDDEGRFAIRQLPAGTFTLSAEKNGFVEAYYGESASQAGLHPIALEPQHRVDDLRIVLPRAGAISGVVYDQFGRPAPGRFMRLLRRTLGHRAELVTHVWPVRGTDGSGRYRFENLAPGTYYVMAAFDAAVLARVYYPDAPRVAVARPITIGVGEERGGIDLRYRAVPTSTVSGAIRRHDGGAIADVTVRLARAGGLDPDDRSLIRRIGATGRFEFTGVPAGAYWLVAHGTAPATPDTDGRDAQRFWGFKEITIGTTTVSTLLELAPGIEISGRIDLHAANGTAPIDRSQVMIALWGVDARTDTLLSLASLRPATAPNGSFAIRGVPAGRYMLRAWRQPWLLGSAVDAHGHALDQPFEVAADHDLSRVTLTLVDRQAGVSGTVFDDQRLPIPDQQLLVFPADPALWHLSALRTQVARTSPDGTFAVAGLAAGEYLLAAIDDVPRNEWYASSLLGRARAGAVPFAVKPGEAATQDLRSPTRTRKP